MGGSDGAQLTGLFCHVFFFLKVKRHVSIILTQVSTE